MKELLISVIVPVYNTMDYLPRCISSIKKQTYKSLEIILVDDGSTDDSGSLCDDLAKTDSRIIVYHKENGGSSSARNLGIEKATGAYIGFIDSDDFIEPTMFESLLRGVILYNLPIAQIGRDELNPDGSKRADICIAPEHNKIYNSEEFLRELLLHKGDCSFCTKLIKKELLDGVKFPVGELNEDFHLLVQLLFRIKGIVSLPDVSYHVNYRLDSNTRKVDKSKFSTVFLDSVNNADLVVNLIREKMPALQDIGFRFQLYQRMEYLLHIPISQMTEENKAYTEIARFVRAHWIKMLENKFLLLKHKLYLLLFAINPRKIRRIHAKMKKIEIS